MVVTIILTENYSYNSSFKQRQSSLNSCTQLIFKADQLTIKVN